jgi:predicted acylesterase/phospholipase RssA
MAGAVKRAWDSFKWLVTPPEADWTDDPHKVYESELGIVSKRRTFLGTGQPEIASAPWPPPNLDTVGLCLSGGGIRSAAFSLGALQALYATPSGKHGDGKRVFSFKDYLSTVSGGGYIGSALSSRMKDGKSFPFASVLGEEEPPALKGIRDRSNYLFPPRD